MKRKSILIISIVLFLIALFSTFVYAIYDDDYEEWFSADGSYSPDYGWFEGGSVDCLPPELDYAMCKAWVEYDSSAITAIQDYYNNNDYCPGLDITDLTNTVDYAGWWATNYPDPYFDTDDDDFDGGDEESEVVCQSPLSMSSDTTYYFFVKFNKYQTISTITFDLTAHESEWVGWQGEYNTRYYNKLADISFNMP